MTCPDQFRFRIETQNGETEKISFVEKFGTAFAAKGATEAGWVELLKIGGLTNLQASTDQGLCWIGLQ